uniref:Adhesion G protein-coupled receptor G3 n=1 Tax=Malurus cyaneus samueli TaxID=2593467 RepID=A0A8C5T582_9PASS
MSSCPTAPLSRRLLQSGQHSWLAGLKTLFLNVSRAVTRDVLITFSPTAVRCAPPSPFRRSHALQAPQGSVCPAVLCLHPVPGLHHGPTSTPTSLGNKPREVVFGRKEPSLRSHPAVRVVVTVLNIQQLGAFKEASRTGQVLDNTVVGITVGESSISGLQEPMQLTFAHRQLPRVMPLPCVFWDGSKGGWHSGGCVTQPGDKGTVCSCDHLTFFTLLLNPALDGSTAKHSTRPCSAVTPPFLVPVGTPRCRFRFEDTVRINLGLHMNLVGSLLLLNLAFLLNSGLSGRTHPRTCRVLGGLTHYSLLCCFTWTALEGCQLYLLFVKVLGIYIHHYLAKLCLIGWGFPVVVVGVAGVIGSYGEYSIQTTDQLPWLSLFRCWITSKHLLVHYITNCGYFGLIFLFNMAVFGVVTQKSCSLQGTGAVQGYRKPWKVALVAAGLFCLLGATWALAFLTYGISSAPVLYLFTILNSLQGLFIFIWLVVLYYPKAKETSGSLSYIIRHDKTTTASQD